MLRCFEDSSVATLLEGSSLALDVRSQTYRYFQFFDLRPNEDLLFNLQSTIGDPDLYIGNYLHGYFKIAFLFLILSYYI